MKVWANGEVVYSQPKEGSGYGLHYSVSRQKLALVNNHSPQFEIPLKEGWNHLLVKISSFRDKNSKLLRFTHCVYDSTPVYEEKNIAWMAEMPERTNACPLVVGDRIITPAEPDELLCLDKKTGKILWRRINGFFDAIPEAERQADPVLRDQAAPLAKELETTYDYEKCQELRRKIRDLLLGIDRKKYQLKLEGHLEGHFGIVGFTTTPVCDGKHIWAFYGFGVAACYDMDGKREWIARFMPTGETSYSCSPAVIGDRLAIVFAGIRGLEAATGKEVWHHPEIGGIASLLPARIKGTDTVTTQRGQMFRASDGKLLWANPHIPPTGDMGWAPGLFLGETYHLLWCGVNQIITADFSAIEGDAWKPKVTITDQDTVHRRPSGEWLDRFTAASPLVLGDTLYSIDQYGTFYAFDLKTQKSLYRQDAGFAEYHSYNAIGVGASPTLGGKNIYVMDNQGMCVVVEPGPQWKPVATNRIETTVPRNWPVNTQELTANGPPVFDGDRIYIRGEKYLYCIGKK
jgi:outer membrane protein assembly factor BamB